MASVLSRRLGKRSLLGARVSVPSSLVDGMLVTTSIPTLQAELSRASSHLVSYDDGQCREHSEEGSRAPAFPNPNLNLNPNRLQLHPGQKVCKVAADQQHECHGLASCTLLTYDSGAWGVASEVFTTVAQD